MTNEILNGINWSIEEFRSHQITDTNSEISLLPLIVTPERLAQIAEWETNDKINRYLYDTGKTKSIEEIEEHYRAYSRSKDKAIFQILLRGDESVGTVGLENINRKKKYAALHIMNGETHHHKQGIGGIATGLLLGYAKSRGLEVIFATISDKNIPSVRLAQQFASYSQPLNPNNYGGEMKTLFAINLLKWNSPLTISIR